jgi:hypothetical protein
MKDDARFDGGENGPERDELSRVLTRWEAPAPPSSLDDRIMESYRRDYVDREPFWQRFFSSSIRVPLPVAVAIVVLLMVSATLALRRTPAPAVQEAEFSEQGVRTASGAESPVVTHTSLAGFEPANGTDAMVILENGP